MQRFLRLGPWAVILAVGLAPAAAPAITFEHTLFTLNVDIDAGSQNDWTGTFGNAFATW